VFPAYSFKRFESNLPLIKGHTGTVTDVAFSPFVETLLGSTSEDGSCKLWVIPQEGITDHVKEWDGILKGHTKKVLALRWHRIADNVLATHGADLTVRVWDVENQKSNMVFDQLPNFATGMRWNPDGKTLGVICKGGALLNFDPRVEGSVLKGITHTGPKACKLAWVDENILITSGSNK
jgi:WD40 repeat protein